MSDAFYRINRGITLNPQSGAPSNPSNGDMYYDSVRNTLVKYINGNWTDVQSRSDVASASSLTSANFTSSVTQSSLSRLTGTTSGSIHGLAALSDAKSLIIYNSTNTTQTVKHQSATEGTAANRIITSTQSDVIINQGESAMFAYDSAQARWILLTVTGSSDGSGFKNILTTLNSKFEGGIASWVTYKDAAATTPVDGTGGSPTVVTISGTTTAGQVLEGNQSLKIAKSAANGQGEGTSVVSKTLDRDDQGKPFYIRFAYDASDSNYNYGDLQVFAYDVTNSQLLSVYNDNNNGQLRQEVGTFNGVVYPQSTCTSIRLIIHCASTNANAYNVYMDEVVITPQTTVSGPVVTDWVAYTPTFTSIGTVTGINFMWRRVGGDMEIKGNAIAGTAAATLWSMTLPSGVSLDTTRLTASNTTAAAGQLVGGMQYSGAASGVYNIVTASATSTTLLYNANVNSGTTQLIPQTANTGANANPFSMWVRIPISGWGPGATLSQNDAGLMTPRLVANTSSTAGTTTVPYKFTNVLVDNYGAYSTTTGQYTVPSSGTYRISASLGGASGSAINIYKNGVLIVNGLNSGSISNFPVNATYPFNVGDTIEIRPTASATANGSATSNYLMIERVPDFNTFAVQGPIVVGASSDWSSPVPTSWSAVTTAPTKGTTTVDRVLWRRVGNCAEIHVEYSSSAAGTGGSGNYLLNLPGGLTMDTSIVTLFTTAVAQNAAGKYPSAVGYGFMSYGAVTQGAVAIMVPYSATQVRIFASDSTNPNTLDGASNYGFGSQVSYAFRMMVPILGWSSDTRLYPSQRIIGTAYLTDEKASGTAGGSSTAGAYQTRTLNTQRGDTGFCSLASNQFTLQPGTYEIEASATARASGSHKAIIANITAATTAIIGQTTNVSTTVDASSPSIIKGRITVINASVFEIQSRVSNSVATTGYGSASTFGDSEVYTVVKIDKVY